MRRRDFLRALPAAIPAIAAVPKLLGAKIRITDVKRGQRLKVIEDLGPMDGLHGTVGHVGGARGRRFVSLKSIPIRDWSASVPAVDAVQVPSLKSQLVGEDPFNLQYLVDNMRDWTGMGTARRLAARPSALAESGQVASASMSLVQAGGRGGETSWPRAASCRRDRHVGHHREGLQSASL